MNWEKLLALKIHEGMGFKDLSAFNLAMLAISRLDPISRPLLGITPAMFGVVLCVQDLWCVVVLDGV